MASAQVLGAICFAALAANGTTRVAVPGPTRDHTERMLRALGVDISRFENVTTIVGPAALAPLELNVPGDFSSAAAWIVAATLHPDAQITLTGVGLNPTRTALIDILRKMGAGIDAVITGDACGEPVGDITIHSADELNAVSVGAHQVPLLIDELPLLAVAMAVADGTSEVRGAGELRVKESDRVGAMTAALKQMGADVEMLPDGWRIRRGKPADARVVTHADHRIAMASAVATWSGVARSVFLDNPDCVAISYPTFWRDAASLGIDA